MAHPSSRKKEMDVVKMKKTPSFKVGRDAQSGQFIPVQIAQRRTATAIVETIKRSPQGKSTKGGRS
jgi:hypothetical protein